jgi:hypothetical protein
MSAASQIGPPQPIDRHEQFLAAIIDELRAIRIVLGGPVISQPDGQVELREPQTASITDTQFQQKKRVGRHPSDCTCPLHGAK